MHRGHLYLSYCDDFRHFVRDQAREGDRPRTPRVRDGGRAHLRFPFWSVGDSDRNYLGGKVRKRRPQEFLKPVQEGVRIRRRLSQGSTAPREDDRDRSFRRDHFSSIANVPFGNFSGAVQGGIEDIFEEPAVVIEEYVHAPPDPQRPPATVGRDRFASQHVLESVQVGAHVVSQGNRPPALDIEFLWRSDLVAPEVDEEVERRMSAPGHHVLPQEVVMEFVESVVEEKQSVIATFQNLFDSVA